VTMVVANHSSIIMRSSDLMCMWDSKVDGAACEEVIVDC
jgi:hypothetical protein